MPRSQALARSGPAYTVWGRACWRGWRKVRGSRTLLRGGWRPKAMGGYNLWDSASAPRAPPRKECRLQRLQLPPHCLRRPLLLCAPRPLPCGCFPPTFQPASSLSRSLVFPIFHPFTGALDPVSSHSPPHPHGAWSRPQYTPGCQPSLWSSRCPAQATSWKAAMLTIIPPAWLPTEHIWEHLIRALTLTILNIQY